MTTIQACMKCGLPVELPNHEHWPNCPRLWKLPVFNRYGAMTGEYVVIDLNMIQPTSTNNKDKE